MNILRARAAKPPASTLECVAQRKPEPVTPELALHFGKIDQPRLPDPVVPDDATTVTIHANVTRLAPGTMVVVIGKIMRNVPIRVRTTPAPSPMNGTNRPSLGTPRLSGLT